MSAEQNRTLAHEYATRLEQRFAEGMLADLQAYPHFVVWRYTEFDGKIKKPPYNPHTGTLATATDSQTWGTLAEALAALKTGKYTGLGFVFSENDPFTGIDIDHCVLSNRITPEAQALITDLWSYTELSPSHTGLHILVAGTIPEGRRKGNIEMYSKERYFTLTTNHLTGSPDTIEDRQTELDRLYERLTPQPQPREHVVYTRSRYDSEVLAKAEQAKNGTSFTALYSGNITGFRSKSEADFTLVLRLLYWTNDDIEQTKRLFRQSGLYDPEKTESPRGDSTYLDVTIANALKKRGT